MENFIPYCKILLNKGGGRLSGGYGLFSRFTEENGTRLSPQPYPFPKQQDYVE
jgi:hypothetical protein